MATVEELGRKVKAKYPGDYDDLSDIEVGQKVKAKFPGDYDDFTDIVVQQQDKGTGKSFGQSAVDAVVDVHKGFLKGAASSVLGAAELAGKLNPVSWVIPPPPGQVAEFQKTRESLAPQGGWQQLGSGIEQVAEFFIPGGAIAKGAKAVQASKAPGIVKALARPAMEAAGAGTVAAVQSGGKPAEIGKAAATAGIASAIMPPGAKAAKALYESAKQSYMQALRPTTKAMKRTAEKVVPELLERRVSAGTLTGLEETAQMQLRAAGEQLDDALKTMSQSKNAPTIPTKPIIDALETYKQGFVVQGVPINERAVKTVEGLQDTISQLGADVSFDSMRRVRQLLDEKVAWRKGFVMPIEEGSAIDATREAAHAIRRELAQAAPDIAKINKEYSFWKRVGDVVGETIERTTPQAPRLGERLMSAAGAAGGFTKGGIQGAALGAATMRGLTKLVNSTAWKTFSAVQQARLADLLASGKIKEANALMGRALAGTLVERPTTAEVPPPPR